MIRKIKDPNFWQAVRSDCKYDEIRALIQDDYQRCRWEEIPVLKYRSRMRFYGDGDRAEFETPYFRRRKYLSSAALLALIYPEKAQYLEDVQECLWTICQEYSWCIPAHSDGTLEKDLHYVDLFAAETGFTLAEICAALEDRLDRLILDRAKSEIRSRVVENYKNGNFIWETTCDNWSAVCSGNIGGTMAYIDPEELDRQLPRLLDTMRRFLSGFPADGTCLEGFGYWHYGFGNFVWFADLLYQHTDGKYDLLSWEKVEAVSSYCQRSFLTGGGTISVADSLPTGKADRGLNRYLHRCFPESVQLLPDALTHYRSGSLTWMWTLRNLLCAEDSSAESSFELQDASLPYAGQAILHREGYSFFMKAGHNQEPHNHNDVGSFILATEKGQIFCDLGGGQYTRQYFDNKTRYDIFCNSSLSHNVPIVNGKPQRYGSEYKGTLHLDGNTVTADIAESYGQAGFTKFTRTVLCEDRRVTLTDSFDADYNALCERFVTGFVPELGEGSIYVNGVRLYFDPCRVTPVIQQQSHSNPPYTVYCINFELNPGLTEVTFIFEVEK